MEFTYVCRGVMAETTNTSQAPNTGVATQAVTAGEGGDGGGVQNVQRAQE